MESHSPSEKASTGEEGKGHSNNTIGLSLSRLIGGGNPSKSILSAKRVSLT